MIFATQKDGCDWLKRPNKNAKKQYKKTIQNRRFFFNSLIDVKLQPFKITAMQNYSHAKLQPACKITAMQNYQPH